MLSSGLHGYFSSPSSCFPFSLSITLYCTCGSDALMWRLVAGDPRRAMVSEFGVVYRGTLLGIRGPCNQGGCLPNIKNMIFHPLDRGFFPALQYRLRLMSCVVNVICHGVSYLNVYMSCCRLNALSYICFTHMGLFLTSWACTLTRLYIHFKQSVLAVMTTALPAKRPTLPAVPKTSKMG